MTTKTHPQANAVIRATIQNRIALAILTAILFGSGYTLLAPAHGSDEMLVTVSYSHGKSAGKQAIVKTIRVLDDLVPTAGYQSLDEAVIAASNRFNEDSISHNREHVGGILKCADSGFFYTHGVGGEGIAPIQFSIPQTKSCRLSALWHTHGGKFEDRAFFSPSDTKAAKGTGKPIYMADYTGTLRVYHAGDRKMSSTRRKKMGALLGLPRGTAVGSVVLDQDGRNIQIASI